MSSLVLLLLLGVRVLQVSSTPHRTGPVSALAQLGRHVVLGAGPKVWVYAFTHHHSDTLVPISFYDSTFYVTSLRVLKSYVLLSDAFKSVQLLQWREPDLLFKGKDYEDVVPYASHFVVDSPSLGMVVCDHRGNVQVPSSTTSRDAQPSTTDHSSFLLTPPPPPHQVLQYDRSAVESRSGNKLVRRADFHLGYRVAFLQSCTPHPVPRHGASGPGRRLLVFGSAEGSAGFFVPLEERLFRRLYALQVRRHTHLPPLSCLSHTTEATPLPRHTGRDGERAAPRLRAEPQGLPSA